MQPPAVADWPTHFLHYLRVERQLSPHTLTNYQRDLERLQQLLSEHQLPDWAELDEAALRYAIGQLHADGLSGRSLQRLLSATRALYRFLAREGWMQRNPALSVQAPKASRRLPQTLDTEQVGALLEVQGDEPLDIRDRAMMELIYSSGLRVSELVGIDMRDIDLAEGALTVLGKGNKTRLLPVGRLAVEAIRAWLPIRGTLANPDETALFVGTRGCRLTTRAVEQRLRRRGEEQGTQGRVYPHRLRHSFASHMLESSGDLRAVQELLGHANISTTQIYTHLDFQHLMEVYEQAHPRARQKRDD
ncbi:MAG: tyrosine recombinase XerC [Marinobacterium sp.]